MTARPLRSSPRHSRLPAPAPGGVGDLRGDPLPRARPRATTSRCSAAEYDPGPSPRLGHLADARRPGRRRGRQQLGVRSLRRDATGRPRSARRSITSCARPRPDVVHVHNLLNLSFESAGPRARPRRGRRRHAARLHAVCPSGGQRVHRRRAPRLPRHRSRPLRALLPAIAVGRADGGGTLGGCRRRGRARRAPTRSGAARARRALASRSARRGAWRAAPRDARPMRPTSSARLDAARERARRARPRGRALGRARTRLRALRRSGPSAQWWIDYGFEPMPQVPAAAPSSRPAAHRVRRHADLAQGRTRAARGRPRAAAGPPRAAHRRRHRHVFPDYTAELRRLADAACRSPSPAGSSATRPRRSTPASTCWSSPRSGPRTRRSSSTRRSWPASRSWARATRRHPRARRRRCLGPAFRRRTAGDADGRAAAARRLARPRCRASARAARASGRSTRTRPAWERALPGTRLGRDGAADPRDARPASRSCCRPCNGMATLPAVFGAIRAQETPLRVRVASRSTPGSTDGTLEFLGRHADRTLSIPPSSFDHGLTRNAALAEARGEYVVLLVQDAVPSADVLAGRARGAAHARPAARRHVRAAAAPARRERHHARQLDGWVGRARGERRVVALDREQFERPRPARAARALRLRPRLRGGAAIGLAAPPLPRPRRSPRTSSGRARCCSPDTASPTCRRRPSCTRTIAAQRTSTARTYLLHHRLHALFGVRDHPDAERARPRGRRDGGSAPRVAAGLQRTDRSRPRRHRARRVARGGPAARRIPRRRRRGAPADAAPPDRRRLMRSLLVVHGFPPRTARAAPSCTRKPTPSTLHGGTATRSSCWRARTIRARPELAVREESRDGYRLAWVNHTFRDSTSIEDAWRAPRVAEAVAPDHRRRSHPSGARPPPDLPVDAHPLDARGPQRRRVTTLHDYWLMCHRGQLLDRDRRALRRSRRGRLPDLPRRRRGGRVHRARCGRRAAAPRASTTRAPRRRPARATPHVGCNGRSAAQRRARGSRASRARGTCAKTSSRASAVLRAVAHVRDRFVGSACRPNACASSPTGSPATIGHRRSGRRTTGPLRAGFVGSLMQSKAPHLAMQAMALLAAETATLDVFGAFVPYHGDRGYAARCSSGSAHPRVTCAVPAARRGSGRHAGVP